jgi:serine/threonine protein kinase
MPNPPGNKTPSVSPDVGATLGGKYRVVRQIGEGGMGVVVEAENLISGKRVAIKWMHPQVAARPEATERFLREARASARVRHPNVVDVYDVVHEGETCFLVMELLEGEPLTHVLERGGMPAHELIALLLDAMRGVSAAHKQGVIHRDIKPDNIFLATETDRAARIPKVLDFGISKVTGSDAMSLTRTGATMGTPMYMSFEQLCGVKDIDARTDVYAFGVIMYEALTGQPPFQAESFPELIVKITNTQPAPPKQLRPDIPRSLDRLVQRAMAKEREQRIASLDELIRDLTPFATASSFRAQMTADDRALPNIPRAGEPPAPPPPSLVVEGRESAPIATPMEANVPVTVPRRRDGLAWLVGAGVLASALGAFTFFGTTNQPPAAPTSTAQPIEPAPSAMGADEPKPAEAAKEEPAPAARKPAPQPTAAGKADDAAARAKEAAEKAEAKRKAAAAAAARGQPITPAGARPTQYAAPTRAPVEQPVVMPPKAAPAAAPAEPANDPRFRAGRPRSQDF